MTETITPASRSTSARNGPALSERGESKGLVARAIGVLTSPRATYAAVAAQPRWLGMLVLIVLAGGIAFTALMSTDVGQRAFMNQAMARADASGRTLTDAQIQGVERMAGVFKYAVIPVQFVFVGFGSLLISAIVLAIFSAMLGGDASFRQVFAIVVHSGVILTLGGLFALPLNYAREALSSPTTLAVFLPMLDENSFPARLAGAFDLFRIWWTISLAIGLGVLYRKRTAPIATTLLVVYAVIALVYAAATAALAGA